MTTVPNDGAREAEFREAQEQFESEEERAAFYYGVSWGRRQAPAVSDVPRTSGEMRAVYQTVEQAAFDTWLDNHDADLAAAVLTQALSALVDYPKTYKHWLKGAIRDLRGREAARDAS